MHEMKHGESVARPPSTLAEFTKESLIVPRLAARNIAGVIRELASAFRRSGPEWDGPPTFAETALQREQQMTTAMDFGAAFPHVRSPRCPQLCFALGRTDRPIVWGQPGSLEVRFVFLIAVPGADPSGYLRLLSGMSQLGKEPSLLTALIDAPGAAGILSVLARIAVRV
jgi:mannitol/fructose-specific phosphotransferase system IIA component (Ntr-type)